jgi:beta-fructofuranosidase
MSLRLENDWLWDFWVARDGDAFHLFHLHAPRGLRDADLRHHSAVVGHAVSSDLRTWELLPDALGRGRVGSFDDRATWTGSVHRFRDRWVMAYTGISDADDWTVQRIGFAYSSDLMSWTRGGPVLEADGRWYEKRGPGVAHEAWRDPFLFELDGRLHIFVTARAKDGPPDGRGVVAHAWTEDLSTWEIGPPVAGPGDFWTYEVTQLAFVGERWRLLFSAQAHEHSAVRLGRAGVVAESGTHLLSADEPLGPFELDGEAFLVGGHDARYYAGRLVETDAGPQFLAWLDRGSDGEFVGSLSDPMPVSVGTDGRLAVATPEPDDRVVPASS